VGEQVVEGVRRGGHLGQGPAANRPAVGCAPARHRRRGLERQPVFDVLGDRPQLFSPLRGLTALHKPARRGRPRPELAQRVDLPEQRVRFCRLDEIEELCGAQLEMVDHARRLTRPRRQHTWDGARALKRDRPEMDQDTVNGSYLLFSQSKVEGVLWAALLAGSRGSPAVGVAVAYYVAARLSLERLSGGPSSHPVWPRRASPSWRPRLRVRVLRGSPLPPLPSTCPSARAPGRRPDRSRELGGFRCSPSSARRPGSERDGPDPRRPRLVFSVRFVGYAG